MPCWEDAPPGLDPIGMYIVNMHQILGHEKAAMAMRVPVGNPRECIICAFEDDPTPERKRAVYEAMKPAPAEAGG